MRTNDFRGITVGVRLIVLMAASTLILGRCATSEQQSSGSLADNSVDGETSNSQQGAAGSEKQASTNAMNSNSANKNSGNFQSPDEESLAQSGNSLGINNAPLEDGGSGQASANTSNNVLTQSNSLGGNLGQGQNGGALLQQPLNASSSLNTGESKQGGQNLSTNNRVESQINPAENPSVSRDVGSLGNPVGTLTWVGYQYQGDAKRLDVQMVTDGSPNYKIFKETNRAGQQELVVRYLNTRLRTKIRRDLDASEFRSPVAYIRMRHDRAFNHTDVVLTLREQVEPTMVNKGSSLMLSFAITDRWFAPKSEEKPVASAEVVEDANEALPALSDSDEGASTEKPTPFVDDPGADKFKGVGANSSKKLVPKTEGGKELVPAKDAPVAPSDGNNFLEDKRKHDFNEQSYTINAVAQADFSTDIPASSNTGGDLIEDAPLDLTVADPAPNQQPAPSGAQPAGTDVVGVESGAVANSSTKKVMRIDFRDAPVNQVIKMIANESNLNFVISPEAGEKRTSISLKNVPWDVALKVVLESNRLGMRELSPGIVRVDFLDNFARDNEAAERARQATESLVPTKVLVMPLNYLKADVAATMARDMLPKADASNLTQQRNVARFRVQSEARSNSVIIEATPNVLNTIKTLLERLDTQTPQVRIQSRLVEFTKNFDDGLGVTWNAPLNIDAGRGLGFGSLPFPNSVNSNFAVDPGGATIKGGSAAFKLGSINNFLALDLKLRAYEVRKVAETLQTQDVVVQDNEEAVMRAGSQDFFNTAAGVGAAGGLTAVTYELALRVTPHITADGAVQMKLDISGDSPKDAVGSAATSRNSRSLNTTLLKRSGETAVIGGLYSSDVKRTELGVPILSRIPLIGALFRSTDKSDAKKDMLIMVTPTILGAGSASTGGAAGSSEVPTMDGRSFGGSSNPSDTSASNAMSSQQNSSSTQQGTQGDAASTQNGANSAGQSSNASMQSQSQE